MQAIRLPNGDLIIPVRVKGPGGIVGDSTEVISPEHPDYGAWLRFAREHRPGDEEESRGSSSSERKDESRGDS